MSGLPCVTTADTVSKECSVTDLVSYVPLNNSPKVWAQEYINALKKKRRDRFDEIVKAGYDSKSSAKLLQSRYLDLYTEYCQ